METYRRRLLIGGCVLAPVSRTCAAGGNRTRMTFQSGDFKSPVSASSTTAAFSVLIRIAGKPGYLNPEFSETMRSEAESNRREGFCRPVPDHSAIGPSITASYEKPYFRSEIIVSVSESVPTVNKEYGTFNNLMQHLSSQRIPHREFSRQVVFSGAS